jgi:NADP-dependent 3-hydroxy acid dehydrogenase YdfG
MLPSKNRSEYFMPQSTSNPVTLKGKTALVTGASAGIGWAAAIALAHNGANLVLTSRREERLKELAAKIEAIGTKAVFYAGDATEEETARKTVDLALSTFGHLDIVINNAGVGNYKNVIDTSLAEYDQLMDSNMKTSFLFTRHAIPHLIEQKSGTVLFVSSQAGLYGFPGEAVYCATKFAQVGFADALDGELRKYDIKVGTICPGGVKTEFAIGTGRTEESIREAQMLESEDVAEAIVFACLQSPKSRILQIGMRHMGESAH